MFPKLYKSDETNFTHNGLGFLTGAVTAIAIEELNGMFELNIEYDSEGFLADVIEEEMLIKAKANDKQKEQLFRIYSITKNHENDNLIIDAQHITYDLANNFVEELEALNLSKNQVMEKIGASTNYPHPFILSSPNTSTKSSTSIYRTNPLQMVGGTQGSVLQIWGGQIERDNYHLILHDRRGSNDGVLVTYKKNLTGLNARFDISNLVTRIFPFVYDESNDTLITVPGKYIDSPNINNYEMPYILPVDYSHEEGIENSQDLMNVASNWFTETGRDKPKVEMEVQFEHLWETEEYKNVAALELVGMGDTITVKHSKLNIEATAIVNRIEYDVIAEKNRAVDVGNVKAKFTDKVNDVSHMSERVEQAEQSASQAVRAANGKNTIYYGPDEPTGNFNEDDLWFRVVDGEYTRTYRYDGIQWQLVVSKDVKDIETVANEARNNASEAVEKANLATSNANEAIQEAQTAFDNAQSALSTATGAENIASTAHSLAQSLDTTVSGHTTKITNIENELSSKMSTIDADAKYATQSALQQTSNNLSSQIVAVSGDIENLQTEFSTINQTVADITTRVGDSEGNISSLQQTVGSFATRITNAEGEISTISQTVSGLQTTVSNKADQSTVTQLAGVVNTKITKSEADGWYATQSQLTQTASSLQSTITSVRDDLDGLEIGGRNYVKNGDFSRGNANWNLYENYSQYSNVIISGESPVGNYYVKSMGYVLSRQDLDDLEEGTYTASAYVKVINNPLNRMIVQVRILGSDGGTLASVTQREVMSGWNRIQVTFEGKPHVIQVRSGGTSSDFSGDEEVHWTGVQLEKGNKVTDWSPAPEDMATQSQISQLSDAINLRVQKGDVINQINIDTSGVLISGKKLILDGDTTVTGTFRVGNANITSIDAGKLTTGTLDAGKVSLINLVGLDIYGSRFRSSTGSDFMEITGGNIRLQNSNNRYLEMSPTGFYGYNAGGDVRFQADSLLVTSSALGTSNDNVYLAGQAGKEARVVDMKDVPSDGEIASYRYLPLRAHGIYGNYVEVNAGVTGNNLYLRPRSGGEVRVTGAGTTDAYYPLRAGAIYSNNFVTTTTSLWMGTDSAMHVVNKGTIEGSTNIIYRDVYANDYFARAFITRSTHAYIGSDGELRVVNKGLTNVYRDVRAKGYFGQYMVADAGLNAYIGSDNGLHVVSRGLTTGVYRAVRARDYITDTSMRENKKNISVYDHNTLEVWRNANAYTYHRKNDDASDKLQLGFMIDELPSVTHSEQGDSFALYALTSYIGKGVKDLVERTDDHEDELTTLRKQNENLILKVAQLEERLNNLEVA